MGSGLIYAVIIVMWAAYFIPRWLRRHEELSETRSVAKFDRAMHILSRREPVGDQRFIVMPPRPEGANGRKTGAAAARSSGRPSTVGPVAMRRRRVLAGLLLTGVLTALLVPLLPVPWWAPLLVVGATLAFLVHLRLQARTHREVSRSRDAVRKRSRSRLMRFDRIERLVTIRREMAADRAADEARWLEAEEADQRAVETERRRQATAAAGWQPVPVPLPTYVSKPMAPRRGPTIDLTRPGTWTETQVSPAAPDEQPFDQTVARPSAGAPAPMSALLEDADDAGEQLDAIIQRRAVND